MTKINIAEFEFDVSAIEKAQEENAKLKKEIILVRQEQAKTNKKIKENGKITDEQARSLAENDSKLKKLNATYRDNQKVISASNTSNKKLEKLLKTNVKTENEAINSTRKLIEARKGLNVVNNAGQIKAINKKINENNKLLDSNADKYSAQKRNIGNYASAFDGLNPKLAGHIRSLEGTITGLKAQKQALAGSTKGLKFFKIALISTGIGAIIVALGLLVGAFLKTQRGIDAVTSVLTPLKVLFQSVIGVVEQVAFKLVDAFKNPQKFILGLMDRLKPLGKILEGVVTLDFSKIKDGFTEVKDGIVKASEATAEFTKEALSRGKKIHELTKQIETAESQLELKRQRNLDIIKQQELISKDKTKTLAERNKALKIAEKATQENLRLENDIVKKKVERLKLQQKSNDTDRKDNKELNDLQAQLDANKTKARGVELRFLGVKNQMVKNAYAEEKAIIEKKKQETAKQLDQNIKNLNTELELYKEQNKQKLSLDQELNDKIVNGQIATYQIIAQRRKEILKQQLDNSKISETQYKLELLRIENEYNDKVDEVKAERQAQEEEKKQKEKEDAQAEKDAKLEQQATDFEIKLETIQLQDDSLIEQENLKNKREQELLKQKLDDEKLTKEQYDQEIKNLETKHTKALDKINYIKESNKRKEASATLGKLSELLGKETVAGKAAGIAAATINTYQGVTEVWRAKSTLPEPFGTASKIISTATVLSSGLGAVKNIAKVKAEKGMLVGATHANGGIPIEAEHGEAILTAKAMQNPLLRNIASAVNVAGGGVDFSTPNTSGIFADGGTVARDINNSIPNVDVQTIKVINDVTETMDVYNEKIVEVENLVNI